MFELRQPSQLVLCMRDDVGSVFRVTPRPIRDRLCRRALAGLVEGEQHLIPADIVLAHFDSPTFDLTRASISATHNPAVLSLTPRVSQIDVVPFPGFSGTPCRCSRNASRLRSSGTEERIRSISARYSASRIVSVLSISSRSSIGTASDMYCARLHSSRTASMVRVFRTAQ